jgi:hypothetical protein
MALGVTLCHTGAALCHARPILRSGVAGLSRYLRSRATCEILENAQIREID